MSIQIMMDRFWSVEEPDMVLKDFTEESKCEVIFRDGHTRNEKGRFSVEGSFLEDPNQLPFNDSKITSGSSTLIRGFMRYTRNSCPNISLGHISLAPSPGCYFMPHNAVDKALDDNPKILVVFDL